MREDLQKLEHLLSDLKISEKKLTRAVNSALLKTARVVAIHASRDAAKKAKLPVPIVKRRFKIKTLRGKTSGVEIRALAESVPAILARARQGARGVNTSTGQIRGAFIRRGRRGHDRVFKRASESRYPLVEQRVPVENALREAMSRQERRVSEIFVKKLTERIKFYGVVEAVGR